MGWGNRRAGAVFSNNKCIVMHILNKVNFAFCEGRAEMKDNFNSPEFQ